MVAVRPATFSDLDSIMEIASMLDVSVQDAPIARDTGFLVSGYSRSDYEAFLPLLLVAVAGDVVAGFIFSMRRAEIPAGVKYTAPLFVAAGDGDFLLIKVVGVHPDWKSRGIGSLLYRTVIAETRLPVFAAVVTGPVCNERSLTFHRRFGFVECARYDTDEGMPRVLLVRRPPLVRPATLDDVPAILRITNEHAQTGKSREQQVKEGFLMSGYPEHLYRSWIGQIRVVEVAGNVEGFLLSWSSDGFPPEADHTKEAEEAAGSTPFVLIKQVGISRVTQGTGLGKLLYRSVLNEATTPVVAQIIIKPRNDRSIAFHEAMGFEFTFPFCNDERGVWRWVRPV